MLNRFISKVEAIGAFFFLLSNPAPSLTLAFILLSNRLGVASSTYFRGAFFFPLSNPAPYLTSAFILLSNRLGVTSRPYSIVIGILLALDDVVSYTTYRRALSALSIFTRDILSIDNISILDY